MSNVTRIVYKRGMSSSSTDRYHVMPITMPRAPWEEGSETTPEGNCVVVLHKETIKKMKRDSKNDKHVE